MAEAAHTHAAKVKYGSEEFQKLLNELCKEAAEFSADFNCKVGIFLDPTKIDENSTLLSFGFPSVESVLEEWKARKPKAEKRKKKKKTKKNQTAKL